MAKALAFGPTNARGIRGFLCFPNIDNNPYFVSRVTPTACGSIVGRGPYMTA